MITLWFQFKTFSSLIQTEVYTHFLKIVYLNSEKFLKHSRYKFVKKYKPLYNLHSGSAACFISSMNLQVLQSAISYQLL